MIRVNLVFTAYMTHNLIKRMKKRMNLFIVLPLPIRFLKTWKNLKKTITKCHLLPLKLTKYYLSDKPICSIKTEGYARRCEEASNLLLRRLEDCSRRRSDGVFLFALDDHGCWTISVLLLLNNCFLCAIFPTYIRKLIFVAMILDTFKLCY